MARLTKQKKLLMEQINKADHFFTAEELYFEIKKKVGIAAIYRFLNNLEKSKEIHSYSCNNKKIYSLDKLNHAHFICDNCGSIKHLNLNKADFLQELVKGKVCHFQLDITGICENCLKKNK